MVYGIEPSGALQHFLHADKQGNHLKGLHQIVLGALAEQTHFGLGIGFRRHVDHGNIALFHKREQFKPIQPRKHDVEQSQIKGFVIPQGLGGGKSIPEQAVFVACIAQVQGDGVGNGGIVFHNKNSVGCHKITPFWIFLHFSIQKRKKHYRNVTREKDAKKEA